MKLSIKMDELNYGDVFIKLARFLAVVPGEYSGPYGKKVSEMTELPSFQIRNLCSALSDEEKAELLSGFASECKESLLQIVNSELKRQQINVTATDFTIDRDLNVTAQCSQLDYPNLVGKFLPAVRKRLLKTGGAAALLRPVIEKASAEQICGLMDRFLGNNKDAFLASMINQNQRKIISLIEKIAEKEHLRLTVASVQAEA